MTDLLCLTEFCGVALALLGPSAWGGDWADLLFSFHRQVQVLMNLMLRSLRALRMRPESGLHANKIFTQLIYYTETDYFDFRGSGREELAVHDAGHSHA